MVRPGQPDHPGAPRRDDPRGRAARGHRLPLRVPQRRLRQVQVHGAATARSSRAPHQESALSAAERAGGQVLACSAVPVADIELEYVPVAPPGGHPAARVHGRASRRCDKVDRRRDDREARRSRARRSGSMPGQYINILLRGRPEAQLLVRDRAARPATDRAAHPADPRRASSPTHVFTRDEGRRHGALRGSAGLVLPARGLATSRSSSSPAPPASRR